MSWSLFSLCVFSLVARDWVEMLPKPAPRVCLCVRYTKSTTYRIAHCLIATKVRNTSWTKILYALYGVLLMYHHYCATIFGAFIRQTELFFVCENPNCTEIAVDRRGGCFSLVDPCILIKGGGGVIHASPGKGRRQKIGDRTPYILRGTTTLHCAKQRVPS